MGCPGCKITIAAVLVKRSIVWFQKISIHPPQRVIGNSEEEGGPKFLKESMSLNWNFQRSGGFKPKKPSMGGVWIFPGTTH